MNVTDVHYLIKRLEQARANTRAFTKQHNNEMALRWGKITIELYKQARREVRGYRRAVKNHPETLQYLDGVVADWEKRIKATRAK